MKAALKISIGLNLVLLGGLMFILANQRKANTVAPAPSEAKPPMQASAVPAPSNESLGTESKPFRWRELESTKDYRLYVANLRAIGCPEATIEDIVRGDADRAFSWERNQLRLDGSGTGPWSQQAEMRLVANLLGVQAPVVEMAASTQVMKNHGQGNAGANAAPESSVPIRSAANQAQGNSGNEIAQVPVPSQSSQAATSSYPLFLQKNVNWSALGFDAGQQAAIAQVRQQFLSAMGSLNQHSNGSADQNPVSANPGASSDSTSNPNDSASLSQWQSALQSADDQLRGLLGLQGWLAYEQQQYDAWYQAQVKAANGGPLILSLANFSLK